jgi:hypothetical protein
LAATTSRAKPGNVMINITMNSEIRKALKVAAALEEIPMSEKLHRILCRDLNRPDLVEASGEDNS